jgi:hypothetical protein
LQGSDSEDDDNDRRPSLDDLEQELRQKALRSMQKAKQQSPPPRDDIQSKLLKMAE